MYEHRSAPLVPRAQFLLRLAAHGATAVALLAGSIVIGMAGYVHFEQLEWLDAFLDATMLLGGMGPVHSPQTPGGKLFAGCFALYAGLVFIVTAGLLLAPSMHRVLHRLHLDQEE